MEAQVYLASGSVRQLSDRILQAIPKATRALSPFGERGHRLKYFYRKNINLPDLSAIRAVIFDLDGVIYLGKRLLPGAVQAVERLRARGIKALFATNNAVTSRAGFARRLSAMGVPCGESEVINTAYAAARLLKKSAPRGKPLFVLGPGLRRELDRAGLRVISVHSRAEWERLRASNLRVYAAVVGSIKGTSYWGICAAHELVRRGSRLVACNRDSSYPISGGTLPGTGSLVSLLECSTGRKADLIGKPSPYLFRLLLQEHGLRPREALVVGDRIETDIAAGRAAGALTVLVLTGIATKRDVARARIKPHLVIARLSDLLEHAHLGKEPAG